MFANMAIKGLGNTIIAAVSSGLIPTSVKNWIQGYCDAFDLRSEKWRQADPYRHNSPKWPGTGRYPYTLGILREFWHMHWPLVAACREMGVAYEILDITQHDWWDQVRASRCDAFLARPSVQYSVWKQMYDERLRILAMADERPVFPDPTSLWVWESKRRMHYWLEANGIAAPRSWIFYDEGKARQFAAACEMPIVFKTDMGSGASGVTVFRDRRSLLKHVRHCFRRGVTTYRRPRRDREHGVVFLQEYVRDAREWRVVRIADSFFAFEKLQIGDFHSGSHQFGYGRPDDQLLDLVRRVTDVGDFRSMAVDVLIAEDGQMLVNELQPFFGQRGSREICRVDDQPGRMVYDTPRAAWTFEHGEFCRNNMCNLRVSYVLERLEATLRMERYGT